MKDMKSKIKLLLIISIRNIFNEIPFAAQIINEKLYANSIVSDIKA